MPKNAPSKNFNISVGGVPCTIYVGPDGTSGGIKESHAPDGRRATVYFQCWWKSRFLLIKALLGTVNYSGTTIARVDPFSYPLSATDATIAYADAMFCTSIGEIVGVGPWADALGTTAGYPDWLSYAYAIVPAEFTCPPYNINGFVSGGVAFTDLAFQSYCVSKTRVAGEVFSPPTGAYIFAGGAFANQPLLDIGASQIRTRLELSCTRVRMPLVPLATIDSLIGTVNSNFFQLSSETFPTGKRPVRGLQPGAAHGPGQLRDRL